MQEAEPHHIQNYKAMARLPREEIDRHLGEFAVMVDGQVISYHSTNREALTRAYATHPYGRFSVQRVQNGPDHMGPL